MTTDEQALRNAIAERPHDWTPRLVLADYLDDTGEPHHAEEAARIRQAADPSTPLGRAVAASRRAWATTTSREANAGKKTVWKREAEFADATLDGLLRDTARVRPLAYLAANQHYVWQKNHESESEPGPAAEHRDASDAFREYARTL